MKPNKITVTLSKGCYYLSIDGIIEIAAADMQSVVEWIERNWPTGTQVHWTVNPR